MLLLLLAHPSAAQVQRDDTIVTETSLVQLNIGVVDKSGHAITTLSRNDFTIFEDGVKQTIQGFEPTQAPFSLVLLLDISGSTTGFRPQLIFAATRFLDAIGPDDRVAVIAFNAKIKPLIGFTNNKSKAAYAISLADKGGGETHLYEALNYSLHELAREGQRRKAIVVLTDGLDTDMRNADRRLASQATTDQEAISAIKPDNETVSGLLNAAAHQGVSIYPLALPSGDPKHLPLPDPVITGIYTAARVRLQSLADTTGGRLNEINQLHQLAELYREVAAELRTLYTLAYQAPGQHARDGKWHEIRVEVAHPDLVARTRPGYYATR